MTSESHIVSETMLISAYALLQTCSKRLIQNAGVQSLWFRKQERDKGAWKEKLYYVIPDGKLFPERWKLSQKLLNKIGTGHTVEKFFSANTTLFARTTSFRKVLKSNFAHWVPKEKIGRLNRVLEMFLKTSKFPCYF